MRISLCMIAYLEEMHIKRCLESFAPAFDELCLVEAIGNRDADSTYTIARDFCETHNKEFKFEKYKNQDEAEWPHVDNYAAARNQSYKLATGEFIFWADCDDLISAEGAFKLRKLIESEKADLYALPYAIGVDRMLMRDRITRKGLGKWKRAVHERLEFTDEERNNRISMWVRDNGCPTFLHKPTAKKNPGYERNVRILNKRIDGIWEDLFYLQQDYFITKQWENVMKVGRLALAFEQLRESERYEILLNFAVADDSSEKRLDWALQAMKLCPWRREALYTAANICLDMERPQDALAYVRMYGHLPRPADPPWTHRDSLYDYEGVHFGSRVLRLNGFDQKALECEQAMFKQRGQKISILHATRGRPEQCVEVRDEWMKKCVLYGSVEHIFAVDHDDEATLKAVKEFRHVVVNPGGTTPRAYNAAAAVSLGHVLILASDDVHPINGWDAAVWNRMSDSIEDERVLAVSDGHRKDRLLCIQIMNRKRYEAQGHAFCEDYDSMFADDEFTHRAYRDGIVIEARDLVFEHRHPSFTGDPNWKNADATYAHTNADERYQKGMAIFRERNPDAFAESPVLTPQ